MTMWTRMGALLAVLALFAAACGDDGGQAAAPEGQTPAGEAPADATPAGGTPGAESPAGDGTADEGGAEDGVAPSCGGSEEWDQLVAAAQEEGEVVLSGPATQAVRENLPPAFEEAFGIKMTYDGGRTSEVAARMEGERAAGIHSVDVLLGGAQTFYFTLYAEEWIADLRELLVGEEIYQDENWAVGGITFQDPDDRYILRVSDYLTPAVVVNTDSEANDLTTFEELLDPKYKGRIAIKDPRERGGGNNTAAVLMETFGEDFVRQLYVEQEPAILADDRQGIEDLSRGRYDVAVAFQNQEADAAIEQGLPLKYVLPTDAPAQRTAGYGLLAVAEPAAHPNAAALLANWLACPEGNELWTNSQLIPSARADVEIDDPPPGVELRIIDPDQEYFDTYDYDFVTGTYREVEQHMEDLLAGR